MDYHYKNFFTQSQISELRSILDQLEKESLEKSKERCQDLEHEVAGLRKETAELEEAMARLCESPFINTSYKNEKEDGIYEFYETFIYDGNQESLPVQIGNGAGTIAAFTHTSSENKAWQVSVYADLAYSGRITGGRIYTRLKDTDDDLIMLADIDIVKGVRMSLDGDHKAWSYQSGYGYYVVGPSTGNSTNPNLDTYTTINGFSPDVKFLGIGGTNEGYKASVVAGRRVFVANVKTKSSSGALKKFGDRIMYSEIGKFDTFLEHNFIDVSKGDYGEYTALESYADRLLAFKQNLVHIINISSPSISNWYLEDTFQYYGVKYHYSVAKTTKGVAWASDDGCYFYDGKEVKKSEAIPLSQSNKKVPRNSPCPCGSGKKYKHCHGKIS